ncbi:Pex12 amino terminal region-domain-containing protein [Melanogaster broomeanus]|nr:Pex12 amino terminal region-domain-containing protein [Melanogaster broomeanus]
MTDTGSSSNSWQAVWQHAWDSAQPTLSSIRDTLGSTTSPSPRTIRVCQLDTELLDQELVHILYEPLQKALSLANTSLKGRFDPELTLLIQLTLYKFSIWNLGASYGARLQGLRYSVPSSSCGPVSPAGLPRRTLLIHGTLTILVPYFYNRFRAHALSRAWPDTPSNDKRRLAWQTLTRIETTHSLLGLLNFTVFLWNGRYRSLTDRLLKMSLVTTISQVKREVSYEFMNRQMVWHAFTEFLLFLLPLVNARSIQRRITRLMSRLTFPAILPGSSAATLRSPSRKHGKYEALPADQCAICAENASYTLNLGYSADALTSLTSAKEGTSQPAADDEVPPFPIYTPYVTSCGHVYCYHCIAERMMRTADDGLESGWECLRCAESVKSADRLEAAHSDTMSEYEFSSEFDTTDMSGSASSYLGSMSE